MENRSSGKFALLLSGILMFPSIQAFGDTQLDAYTKDGLARQDTGHIAYSLPEPPIYGGGQTGYYNIDVEMTLSPSMGISSDFNDDLYPLAVYFGVEFSFENGGTGQMGLLDSGRNSPGREAGRIAKFHIAGIDNARSNGGAGACYDSNDGSFTIQGNVPDFDFGSCTLPFDWKDHETYRLRIWACCNTEEIAGTGWGVWVIDGDGVDHPIGAFTTPPAWGRLTQAVVTFTGSDYWNNLDNLHNHYDETDISDSECIPVKDAIHWSAVFGTPVGDSGNDGLTPAPNSAQPSVPYEGCRTEASVVCGSDNTCINTYQQAATKPK